MYGGRPSVYIRLLYLHFVPVMYLGQSGHQPGSNGQEKVLKKQRTDNRSVVEVFLSLLL